MASEFIWTLPTAQPGGLRRWLNVARAAELAGWHALRVPSGPGLPDAWLLAARLAAELPRIRFLVDLQPGLELPAVAAQRAATLQQLTGQRLSLCLPADVDAAHGRHFGDPLNHDDRHARAAQYLQVLRQVWRGRGSGGVGQNFAGDFYRLEAGGLYRPPPEPPLLYVGGGTPAAERLAAQHGQVAFHWAAPSPELADRVGRLRVLALQQGRALRVGCRVRLPAGRLDEVARQIDAAEGLGVDSFLLLPDDPQDDPLRVARELQALRRPAAQPRPALQWADGVRS